MRIEASSEQPDHTVTQLPAVVDSLTLARDLVLRYGSNATAYQILNPGISHWFSHDRSAVVGYVASYGYRVVAGAPVCASAQVAAVVAEFEHDAEQLRQRVCFFGTDDIFASLVAHGRPAAQMLLGAQPTWNPHHWAAIVANKPSLRSQVARARAKQVTITLCNADPACNYTTLAHCQREWLQSRRLPPMRFMVEPDILSHLADRRVFVAEYDGAVVGFLIATPIPLRNGWLVEQTVRTRSAPNGTVELLLDTAMQILADNGAAYVTLGLSPLSRWANVTQVDQPRWLSRLLALLRHYGHWFYNFNGLDAFKAKFQPEAWEPVYAVTSDGTISLHTLYAIAGAFSGTSPTRFVLQGAGTMLQRQVHEAGRRVHLQAIYNAWSRSPSPHRK